MQKDESMKWPFKKEELRDNVIEWAAKIKALGDAWGALSWHVNLYDGDRDALARCGEYLGMILMDYAGLIEDVITENWDCFVDTDQNIMFPLARCQEVCDFIGKTRQIGDLTAIDSQLAALTSFLEDTVLPAMRLKHSFEDMKNEIIAQHKNAPVAKAETTAA
ncbi:MAG: hypothetical protein WC552_08985 [Candidatus Omnitrophota bacterium]